MLLNSFDKTILAVAFDAIGCFDCGASNPVDFHHITGRAGSDEDTGPLHRSPLNACPLCRQCHTPEARSFSRKPPITDERVQIKLLIKVYLHLKDNGYQFTHDDREFYRKHRDLYSKGFAILKSLTCREMGPGDDF